MSKKRWSVEETAVFIGLYGDYFQQLEKMAKKKPIHLKISEKLKENGYDRDAIQVAKKISNLREEYKKKKPGATGDETPNWIHYEALHKIFYERPALNSNVAVTSKVGLDLDDFLADAIGGGEGRPEERQEEESGGEDIRTNSPSPSMEEPKKKRARFSEQTLQVCNDTLSFLKTQATKRDEERQEVKSTNASLVDALNRIASSSESIADSIKNGNVTIL